MSTKDGSELNIAVRRGIVGIDGGNIGKDPFVPFSLFVWIVFVVVFIIVCRKGKSLFSGDGFLLEPAHLGFGLGDEGVEGVGGHFISFGEVGVFVGFLPSFFVFAVSIVAGGIVLLAVAALEATGAGTSLGCGRCSW